jgi:hypothetical protein
MKLKSNNVLLLKDYSTYFMQIDYLVHSSIDKKKWDQSILDAGNGLLYACAWYLDCISPQWDALVADDYRFVFPVTLKRKYKIPYIVQPFLAQQLGLFGNGELTEDVVKAFINRLPSYSFEINLNYANKLEEATKMTNLVISLEQNHNHIRKAYTSNTIRNIRKAEKNDYIYTTIEADEFIAVYKAVEHPDTTVSMQLIEKLIRTGDSQGQICCCALLNKAGSIVSALAYGNFKGRITYLFPVSTIEGKHTTAMFQLVDELLKEKAEKAKLFDFEGSMLDGVARFYKGFGAEPESYRIIKQLRPSFLVGKI